MLKLNEKVVYGTTGVCVVDSVENKRIGRQTKSYYVLKPISQATATVYLPADNEKLLSKVRAILSADDIKLILKGLNDEPDVWADNDNERRLKFSSMISSGDRKDCLLIMRCLRNRQRFLSGSGKRLHIADERALKEVERLIYDEFSIALDIRPEEVNSFINKELNSEI